MIEGLIAAALTMSLPWLIPAALEHRIELRWVDRLLTAGRRDDEVRR